MEVQERTGEVPEEVVPAEVARDLSGVSRYYELAKRAEWQVKDLGWGEMAPVPEYKGSPQKLARRQDLWRSVITQQLQADELAVEMATQLFALAPDHEAKLYYTTMVQDEARHTEAWLKLIAEAGGDAERDPHLEKLAKMQLEAGTLEEKVFQMQVFWFMVKIFEIAHFVVSFVVTLIVKKTPIVVPLAILTVTGRFAA